MFIYQCLFNFVNVVSGEMIPDSQPLNSNSCLADLFMQLLNHSSEVVRRGSALLIILIVLF